jgi:hypothetical protein
MLSKSPTTTTETTFAFSGDHTVRLARNVLCPCGRLLLASDIEVEADGVVNMICGGCHGDIFSITKAASAE